MAHDFLSKYKPRLMAHGLLQEFIVEYFETLALILNQQLHGLC